MESLILALIFNLTDKCACTCTYMYVCGIGTCMYCKIVWLCFWMYYFIQLTNSACIKPFAFYLNNAALCTNASTHAQATKVVGTCTILFCVYIIVYIFHSSLLHSLPRI